jgi:hypothetical protein
MSGDWRRLHQVRGVCGGSPACLAETGLTGLGSQGTGSFEVEDTRRDRKACVEAMRDAVAGHPSDGAMKTNSQSALGGRVS